MNRVNVNGWLFPTLLCFGLCVVYMFEWRASRQDQRAVASEFAGTIRDLHSKVSLEGTQTRSLLKLLREDLERLQFPVLPDLASGTIEELATRPSEDEKVQDPQVVSEEEVKVLPTLPEGINPLTLVQSIKLREFYDNPLFNPQKVQLDTLDLQRASTLVAHAQARLMTLTSDLHLLLAEEKPKLLQDGTYVDYQRGQKPEALKGVYTTGELLPEGGVRIYPFYREEYRVQMLLSSYGSSSCVNGRKRAGTSCEDARRGAIGLRRAA